MNTAVKTYTNYNGFIEALRNADASRLRMRPGKTETASELKFRPITHSDMETVFQYLQMEKGRTTDFSYAGILMWVDYFKYEFAISDDTLFIKGVGRYWLSSGLSEVCSHLNVSIPMMRKLWRKRTIMQSGLRTHADGLN